MDAVWREHAQMVYRYLLAQTQGAHLAEELTQETFCEAIRCADQFEGRSQVSTWLCGIAKHLLYAYRRKHPAMEPLSPSLPSPCDPELEMLEGIRSWKNMKTELSCSIVRDLLPSYADGLTSLETNRAIEAHLTGCPDCARACARMKGQEHASQDNRREGDFLKRQRRKTRLTALVTALAVLMIAAGVWLIPTCFIGTPLDAEAGIDDQVVCSAAVGGIRSR